MKRTVKKQFWFSKVEAQDLKKKAKKACLTEAALIRLLLRGYEPREKPDERFYDAMRELSAIGNNINQLAIKANALGFVDSQMLKNEALRWHKFQAAIEREFLASKLEYNMQPIHPEPVNLVAIARQSVVDFINLDMEEKYPIEWNTDEALTACAINGDKELLRRAIGNLITNSQTHNPDGCTISVCVRKSDTEYKIVVEDNGVGVTDEKLEKLRTTPHYMMSDSGTTEPRHGLGLLIVGQIVSAHNGTVSFDHGKQGGFAVTISFPIPKDSHTQ